MVSKRKKSPKKNPNHNGTRPQVKGLLVQSLEELERKMIMSSLTKHDGCVRAASIELGCNRGGLYKRMTRLGIEFDDYREWEWAE